MSSRKRKAAKPKQDKQDLNAAFEQLKKIAELTLAVGGAKTQEEKVAIVAAALNPPAVEQGDQDSAAQPLVSHDELASVFNTEPFENLVADDPEQREIVSGLHLGPFQQAFLKQLQHEPKLVQLFSLVMGQHYKSLEDSPWNTNEATIFCLDFSTVVLLSFLQYLRGYVSVQDWSNDLLQMDKRAQMQVLFPLLLPPCKTCSYYSFLLPWYIFNLWRNKELYAGGSSVLEAQLEVGKLFADLQMFQPWASDNRFSYHGIQLGKSNPELQLTFTQPRMTVFFFDVYHLYGVCTKLYVLTFHDLTHMRDLMFTLKERCDLYEGTKKLLQSLKLGGVDLTNTLFMTLDIDCEFAEQFTKAVVDAGAHYAIYSRVDTTIAEPVSPETWRNHHHYAQCQSLFRSVKDGLDIEELHALSDLPQEEGKQPAVFVSSLDVNEGENRKQLICACDQFSLANDREEEEKYLARHNGTATKTTAHRAIESRLCSAMGMGAIREGFFKFVWQQLLKEGKVKSKKVNERMVADKCYNTTIFLHYFAQFCEPALQYMLLYMQRNKEGLFGQRIDPQDAAASLEQLLAEKK